MLSPSSAAVKTTKPKKRKEEQLETTTTTATTTTEPQATEPKPINLYDRALMSQSACNFSGLVHGLARDMDTLWQEARARGEGSDYIAKHPVVRLYLEQLTYLAGIGIFADDSNPWARAHAACREKCNHPEWA